MKKTLFVCLAILAITNVAAEDLAIPNTFEEGAVASAAEVNENFTAVEAAVNANTAALESQIAELVAQIADLQGSLSTLEARAPIAYGVIDSGGRVLSGTGNFEAEPSWSLPSIRIRFREVLDMDGLVVHVQRADLPDEHFRTDQHLGAFIDLWNDAQVWFYDSVFQQWDFPPTFSFVAYRVPLGR